MENDIETKKLILQCNCGELAFMQWLKFEDCGDEDYHDIYISMVGTDITGLWRRLKAAWGIMRHGIYENDGVLMWDEKEKLVEWLQNIK